jgi:hypothetical protein
LNFLRKVSTLGLGSYKNQKQQTFSNIGDSFSYIELNDEEDWKPRYYSIFEELL